ncbi:MAG: hypothetical protein A3G23_04825 [Bacteroidetes bacterium RIFCSPLOWO2_12_FULL_37_12]|nr:MAG: hypothetical protein A3G23_04825 [Bacteroidetes bacterium RIFCSPLOWO2_12_FULL_37_12]
MKNTKLFIILCVATSLGCKKEEQESATPVVNESNFDATKGWKLLKTIPYDDVLVRINNDRKVAVFDIDYKNNNLRVFYWEGRKSQQSYIYSIHRVDEYDASGNLVKREDPHSWISPKRNGYPIPPYVFQHYILYKETPCLVALYNPGSGGPANWGYYENKAEGNISKGISGSYEAKGVNVRYDDNMIFAFGNFNQTRFFANWFQDGIWTTYKTGDFSVNNDFYKKSVNVLTGIDLINNEIYAFMGGNFNKLDSSFLAIQRFDTTQSKFITVKEKHIPFKNIKVPYWADTHEQYYFNNNGSPLMVLENDSGFVIYKVDMTDLSFTEHANVTFPVKGSYSLVAFEDEIYMGYYIDGIPSVVKFKGNATIQVGKAGITKGSASIKLKVVNNKIHVLLDGGAEAYIAVPE